MNTSKLLMAAAAIAFMAGTGGAFAQQEPAHGATGEKLAPRPCLPRMAATRT
jgi:hypothetical protein